MRFRCALAVAMVGLLVAGCAGASDPASPAPDPGGAELVTGADPDAASGDAQGDLRAALGRMDELQSYRGDLTMVMAGLPNRTLTTTGAIQTDVVDQVIFQVTDVTGAEIGFATGAQETLIRDSEMLVHSALYSESFGGEPDTWYRAPTAPGGQGAPMLVSMYFTPAAQAITAVTDEGVRTVGEAQVRIYRAQLDPIKFRAALDAADLPGGITAEDLAAPELIEYGVGDDGYVRHLAFNSTGLGELSIDLHSFNAELDIPDPSDIRDMPAA